MPVARKYVATVVPRMLNRPGVKLVDPSIAAAKGARA
jgi:hypothetical protein